MYLHVVARSGEAAKSGPIGLAIILILCVGCYFLFRSMAKHLRKVREEFPDDSAADDRTPARTPAQQVDRPGDTDQPDPPAAGPPAQ
jgi:hypothetical protein